MNLQELDDEYDSIPPPAMLSTGILGLDLLLGGGFIRGQIAEVLGKEGVGKSTVAYYTAAQTINELGKHVAWIEAGGNEFIPRYARNCGVQLDKLAVLTPMQEIDSLLRLVIEILECGDFPLVILEDIQRGIVGKDRKWQQVTKSELRDLAVAARRSTLLLTTSIEQTWVASHPFWVGQRVQVLGKSDKMEALVLSGYGNIGTRMSIPLVIEQGVDDIKHLVQLAVATDIVKEHYGRYTYQGEALGHGINAATKAVRENPELQRQWREEIRLRWVPT